MYAVNNQNMITANIFSRSPARSRENDSFRSSFFQYFYYGFEAFITGMRQGFYAIFISDIYIAACIY